MIYLQELFENFIRNSRRKGLVAGVILIGLLAILFGSMKHVAFTFNTIEGKDYEYAGWIIAAGMELALVGAAFTVKEKRKIGDKKGVKWSLLFIIMFCGINMFGNYYFGLAKFIGNDDFTLTQYTAVDILNQIKRIVFSMSLPLVALALIDMYLTTTRSDLKDVRAESAKEKKLREETERKDRRARRKPRNVKKVEPQMELKEIAAREEESKKKAQLQELEKFNRIPAGSE